MKDYTLKLSENENLKISVYTVCSSYLVMLLKKRRKVMYFLSEAIFILLIRDA